VLSIVEQTMWFRKAEEVLDCTISEGNSAGTASYWLIFVGRPTKIEDSSGRREIGG
jgi:hypothetical protein